jgi:hypothetical protein
MGHGDPGLLTIRSQRGGAGGRMSIGSRLPAAGRMVGRAIGLQPRSAARRLDFSRAKREPQCTSRGVSWFAFTKIAMPIIN